MGHHFHDTVEMTVPASVEDVWEAISTGPGVQSWFLGRTEIEDGAVRMFMGEYNPVSAVTAAEPGKRFAHRTADAPDGRFIAYEYLIEGRDRASTVLRVVTSGFIPGDDWAEEYEAMRQGGALYAASLREYLTHFAPRTGTPLNRWVEIDWHRVPELIDSDGVVFHANEQTIGIRTDNALYRYLRAMNKTVMLSHIQFAPDGRDWPTRTTAQGSTCPT
ncbi:SRPBCC family protein [Actinokineospora sp. NPDC004072]